LQLFRFGGDLESSASKIVFFPSPSLLFSSDEPHIVVAVAVARLLFHCRGHSITEPDPTRSRCKYLSRMDRIGPSSCFRSFAHPNCHHQKSIGGGKNSSSLNELVELPQFAYYYHHFTMKLNQRNLWYEIGDDSE
jgi:hypothetical protein